MTTEEKINTIATSEVQQAILNFNAKSNAVFAIPECMQLDLVNAINHSYPKATIFGFNGDKECHERLAKAVANGEVKCMALERDYFAGKPMEVDYLIYMGENIGDFEIQLAKKSIKESAILYCTTTDKMLIIDKLGNVFNGTIDAVEEIINAVDLKEGNDGAYTKELLAIPLSYVHLMPNVRHAHLWDDPNYIASDISNYNPDSIEAMATTIVDNLKKGLPAFDNEPWVWQNEVGHYEVQVGNTRVITLIAMCDGKIEVEGIEDVQNELKDIMENGVVNFWVVSRELTDGEKRRENTVRTQQHWMATAEGFLNDVARGVGIRKIASVEGMKVKDVSAMVACARDLCFEAKLLASKDIILQKGAEELITMDKETQHWILKDIVENVKIGEEVKKIKNASDVDTLFRGTFHRIWNDDYPMKEFVDVDGNKHLAIDQLDWIIKRGNGMFETYYATDFDKAHDRFEAYKAAKVKELLQLYPDAKVLNEDRYHHVHKEKVCVSSYPVILGHKLAFKCTDPLCPVHGYTSKEQMIKEVTQKVEAKSWKQVAVDTIEDVDANVDSIFGTTCLRAIWLDMIFLQMGFKAREVVIEGLKEEFDITDEIYDWRFSFFNIVNKPEEEWEHAVKEYLTNDKDSRFEYRMAYIYLKDNMHKKDWLTALFNEVGVELVLDEKAKEEDLEKNINRVLKKSKASIDLMNFARYNLCLPITPNHLCRGYMFISGKKVPMRDTVNLEKMEFYYSTKQVKELLKNLGASKFNKLGHAELVELLKARIEELSPLVENHVDDAYSTMVQNYELGMQKVEEIRSFIVRRAMEIKDQLEAISTTHFLNAILFEANERYREWLASPMKVSDATQAPEWFEKEINKKITDEVVMKGIKQMVSDDFIMHALLKKAPRTVGASFSNSTKQEEE